MTGVCVTIVHVFTCEQDKKLWPIISAISPDVQYFFEDIGGFAAGVCRDVRTEAEVSVASLVGLVDVLLAGFSCIDASVCKRKRHQFATGVEQRFGSTGRTWDGCRTVVQVLQPLMSMFENVIPLLQFVRDTRGDRQRPAIETIERDLHDGGGICTHRASDAKAYGFPHQRNRVYILATNNSRIERHQLVSEFARALKCMQLPCPVAPMSSLFPVGTPVRQPLSDTQLAKVEKEGRLPRNIRRFEEGVDVYVGLHHSNSWAAEVTVDCVPCLRPTSKIWSRRLNGILRAPSHLVLQGWPTVEECPRLARVPLSDKLSAKASGQMYNGGQFIANFVAAIAAGGLPPPRASPSDCLAPQTAAHVEGAACAMASPPPPPVGFCAPVSERRAPPRSYQSASSGSHGRHRSPVRPGKTCTKLARRANNT